MRTQILGSTEMRTFSQLYFDAVTGWNVSDLGISPTVSTMKDNLSMFPSKDVGIVVTNCGSRLEWLHEIRSCEKLDIIIFEKCGETATVREHLLPCTTVTLELNGSKRGAQYTTYFHYIVTRYERLHEFTIFVKSSAIEKSYFRDERGRNAGFLPMLNKVLGIPKPGFLSLSNTDGCGISALPSVVKGCYHLQRWKRTHSMLQHVPLDELRKFVRHCSRSYDPSICYLMHNTTDIRISHACNMYSNLCAFTGMFKPGICSKGWFTCNYDNYGASAKRIRYYDKEFYVSLLQALTTEKETEAFLLGLLLEYSMNVIWNCSSSHAPESVPSRRRNITCYD